MSMRWKRASAWMTSGGATSGSPELTPELGGGELCGVLAGASPGRTVEEQEPVLRRQEGTMWAKGGKPAATSLPAPRAVAPPGVSSDRRRAQSVRAPSDDDVQ